MRATSFDDGSRATAPRGDFVVGADGANGTTAKAFGLGGGIVHGVAYEGNVGYGTVDRDRYARRAVVELADIPGGYGWVFPKGDHVNVGVGALAERRAAIREHLARVCEAHGLDASSSTACAATACRCVAARRASPAIAPFSSATQPA